MAKARKPMLDYVVYLAVRVAVCVLQALPLRAAFAFAEALAWLAYHVDKRHRNVAAENLRHAFPDRDPDPLVRACYRHFAGVAVEIALLPRKLHVENWRKYVTLIHPERIVPALIRPRPLLIVTAHFGNWEVAGFGLGALGFRTHAIARVLDNPHLEQFLKSFRQKTGQTIIAKKDDFDRLADVMRNGGKVATLGDQDAGPRGVFVEFFGRPASAHKAVALMAIEFDALLVVTGTPRVGSMQYEVIAEEVIDPRDYAHRSDAVKAITQRYHAALERLIRQHPEQYFWLHRRWKTAAAKKAASRTLPEAA